MKVVVAFNLEFPDGKFNDVFSVTPGNPLDFPAIQPWLRVLELSERLGIEIALSNFRVYESRKIPTSSGMIINESDVAEVFTARGYRNS